MFRVFVVFARASALVQHLEWAIKFSKKKFGRESANVWHETYGKMTACVQQTLVFMRRRARRRLFSALTKGQLTLTASRVSSQTVGVTLLVSYVPFFLKAIVPFNPHVVDVVSVFEGFCTCGAIWTALPEAVTAGGRTLRDQPFSVVDRARCCHSSYITFIIPLGFHQHASQNTG